LIISDYNAFFGDCGETGFAINCTHLIEDISLKLLDAGLDTIICSIDGIYVMLCKDPEH